MKEQEFINIITKQIGNDYIGDDCAYLKDLGIVISQDSLVEDIHFKRKWYTPFQLGYKSVAVNISDILASGAKPEYVTIALSLPSDISSYFIEEFYKGASKGLCGAKIVGGDITGADKIFISITAIGSTYMRKISSRANAKVGYDVIISNSEIGNSARGLIELENGGQNKKLIQAHLEPFLEDTLSYLISTQTKADYAMMDTSDSLADALFKIAVASNVSIDVEFISGMFGAEDYKLVAALPKDISNKIPNIRKIGSIVEKKDYFLKIDDKKYFYYDELGMYNHFGGGDCE